MTDRLQRHLNGMQAAIENTWQKVFADCGRTPAELTAIRHIAMGSARGFAVERIFHPGATGDAERELLTGLVHLALLGKVPASTDMSRPPKKRSRAD